jgi:hypothetical protein
MVTVPRQRGERDYQRWETSMHVLNICVVALALSTAVHAFGSGSYTCESVDPAHAVRIDWSVQHGIGSNRFGPVIVAIEGWTFKLWPEQQPPADSAEVKNFGAAEVGYWKDEKRLLMHLTDREVLRSILEIETERRGKAYEGGLVLRIYPQPQGKVRKVAVRCYEAG